MRVLVTGSAGFVGSHVVASLINLGHDVTGVDSLDETLYPAVEKQERIRELQEKGMGFLEVRIGDLQPNDGPFDWIVHSAALAGLSPSWVYPERYIQANVVESSHLAELALGWGSQKFIFLSTSSVYGNILHGDEESPTKPLSPYGLTKLTAEKLIANQLKSSQLDLKILRLFSVYGPGQRPDMAYRKIMSALLLDERFELRGDGTQSRANTYVGDVVGAVNAALISNSKCCIFNISGGQAISLNDAIKVIEEVAGMKLDFHKVEPSRGDQTVTIPDITLAKKELALGPMTQFSVGIRKQWEWIQKRSVPENT